MNFIDIIIIILVLLTAFKGFSRGLIKELVSLISLIVGVYIASNFSVYVEKHLNYNFPKIEEYNTIISFALVFLIIYLSLKLAGIIIHKFVKTIQLNLINKILGLLFGTIKAIIRSAFEAPNNRPKILFIKLSCIIFTNLLIITPASFSDR